MSRILQIIAITLIVAWLIYKALPFLRRMKGAFKKIHLNPDSSLSDEQYRKLALGAIYSEQQSAVINSLNTGIPTFEIKSMLTNWWQVNDKYTAKETLDFLLDNALKPVFPVVLQAYKTQDESVIAVQITDSEKQDKAYSQLQHLKDTLADLQCDEIVFGIEDIERLGADGWELGRLVYVARMCYDVGFIKQEEAWDYIDAANKSAKEKFSSWKDFGYSYAVGRSLWSGKDSANEGIADIAKYLLSEPESPWVKLPW